MEISRRELLAFGMGSVVLLTACGSDTPQAVAPQVTDDNPVIDLQTTVPAHTTTVAATPASMTTASASTSTSSPPSTASPAPDTMPSIAAEPTTTVAPAAQQAAAARPQAQPVPKEGQETYLQLGTIQIPAIGVDMPLGEGVTLTNLNHGPGHWPGTAMPGALGNSVIGGHRVSHTHPFRDLDTLHPGDTVTMSVAAGTFTYAVVSTEIVLPSAVRILDQTDSDTATLFACHPKGRTTQRIVVHLNISPN